MAAAGQHELGLATKQLGRLVARAPWRDVVVGACQAVHIAGDLFQVDGRAADFQGIGAGERVALEHLDQVAVEGGGQACGVVVPEQDIEHRRLVAQQVVVDPIVPYQVIGSHPGKYLGHVLPSSTPAWYEWRLADSRVCSSTNRATWLSRVVSSTLTNRVRALTFFSPRAA